MANASRQGSPFMTSLKQDRRVVHSCATCAKLINHTVPLFLASRPTAQSPQPSTANSGAHYIR